jgi:hypothetical protein
VLLGVSRLDKDLSGLGGKELTVVTEQSPILQFQFRNDSHGRQFRAH